MKTEPGNILFVTFKKYLKGNFFILPRIFKNKVLEFM